MFCVCVCVKYAVEEAAAGGDHGISVDQKKQLLGGINSVPFHPISQLLRSLVWLCVCLFVCHKVVIDGAPTCLAALPMSGESRSRVVSHAHTHCALCDNVSTRPKLRVCE